MLISYEDKVRIAQESLTKQSANQIAEATGIHRSVVQKALNDPEVIDIQGSFKSLVRNKYLRAFDQANEAKQKANKVEPNEVESNEVEPNGAESSVSEEDELRIREVKALESIATSLANLQLMLEDAAKQKMPTQEELTEETRDELAVKVAELRINATGSKPLAWKRIREKLGLKNDEFHKVIRLSEGYRTAVIERIKSLKASEEGWEYSGKLEVLTGIEVSEKELA